MANPRFGAAHQLLQVVTINKPPSFTQQWMLLVVTNNSNLVLQRHLAYNNPVRLDIAQNIRTCGMMETVSALVEEKEMDLAMVMARGKAHRQAGDRSRSSTHRKYRFLPRHAEV